MEKLKICISYEYRGKRAENTRGVKLLPAARAYLRALEELAGCPSSILSTGPDRYHTMVLRDPSA